MSRTNLTIRELQRLSTSIADLYRTTDRSALAHQIAKLASHSLSVELCGTWEIDAGTLAQTRAYANPRDEEFANESWPIFAHYAQRYPMFTKPMKDPKNVGTVQRSSEILPHSLLEPIGFMDDYARPNNCEYQLIYYFRHQGTRCAMLTCSRKGRDYTDKEKMILEFLTPHFQSAYENSGAFEDKKAAIARANAMQQTLAVECLWLDNEFKVREATGRVSHLIREFLRQEFSGTALPEKILAWLRTCLPLGSGRTLAPLMFDNAGASLKIRLYPDKLPGLHLLTFSRRVTVPTLDDLRPLGLTRRESETLLWVAQAKTNDEIARLLGCSSRTIAKHMEHLLLKLKVENRAAAMLLVSDLLQN